MATKTSKTVTANQYRTLAKQFAIADQQARDAAKLRDQIRKELLDACTTLEISEDTLTFKLNGTMETFNLSVSPSQISTVNNSKAIAAIGQKAFNENASISQKALIESGVEKKIAASMTSVVDGNINVSLKKSKN